MGRASFKQQVLRLTPPRAGEPSQAACKSVSSSIEGRKSAANGPPRYLPGLFGGGPGVYSPPAASCGS